MIRKMQNADINRVADIWLKTNLKAHDFISEQYWMQITLKRNASSATAERLFHF